MSGRPKVKIVKTDVRVFAREKFLSRLFAIAKLLKETWWQGRNRTARAGLFRRLRIADVV